MKSISIGVFASVLALVSAFPLEKKDVPVVMETVVKNVVETVDATTTVWVTPGQLPPTQAAVAQQALPVQKVAENQGPKQVAVPSSTSTSSTPPPPPQPTTTSTAAPVAPYVAPTTTPTSTFTTPPPPPPFLYVPSSSSVVQNAPVVQSAPAPASSAPSSGAPSGGACGQVGGKCSGDVTVYDPTAGFTPEVFKNKGFGACGWLNNGTTEDVFALAREMMGTQSNGNPYCGRIAKITLNGNSVTGKLVDKCGACVGQSIDLSDHLFAALGASTTTGRYSNVEWSFTS